LRPPPNRRERFAFGRLARDWVASFAKIALLRSSKTSDETSARALNDQGTLRQVNAADRDRVKIIKWPSLSFDASGPI
jgi:hypothetical protein